MKFEEIKFRGVLFSDTHKLKYFSLAEVRAIHPDLRVVQVRSETLADPELTVAVTDVAIASHLVSRDGVTLYEGDIVRFPQFRELYIVEHEDRFYYYREYKSKDRTQLTDGTAKRMVIVGNKWENPDIFKEDPKLWENEELMKGDY